MTLFDFQMYNNQDYVPNFYNYFNFTPLLNYNYLPNMRINTNHNTLCSLQRINSYFKLNEMQQNLIPSTSSNNCTKQTNCECIECGKRFGNLPLLLEVIDKQKNQTELEPKPGTSGVSTKKVVNRRQMKCPTCEKIFTHKGDLKKHLRVHSKEKPYTCHICNRKFAHTSNLNRHLKVHSGVKPFSCDKCGKKFSRKDKLEAHKLTKICKKRSLKYQESFTSGSSS